MNTKIKNYLGVAVIGGIIFVVIAGLWYVGSFSKSVDPSRTFQVSGEGEVVAVPDVAEINMGVRTEGGTNLAALQEENTEKVNDIIASLKNHDIDEKDIQTQSYNITPRYQYYSCPPSRPVDGSSASSEPCPPPEIVGYTINQQVAVTIRDLDITGDVMADVVSRGVNNISGPRFIIDDPTELQNEARQEAIDQAKERARDIADAGDFRVGDLISLHEGSSQPTAFYQERAFASDDGLGGAAPAPSIEPGSQKVRVNVILTYEIK